MPHPASTACHTARGRPPASALRLPALALASLVTAVAGIHAAPAAAACPGATDAAIRTRMTALVNGYRASAGLPPVHETARLDDAARDQACRMAAIGRLAHDGPAGTVMQRATRHGYRACLIGEAVAFGYHTPAQTAAQWMASPPHRAILMNRGMHDMGLSVTVRERRPTGPWCWPGAASRRHLRTGRARRARQHRLAPNTPAGGIRPHQAARRPGRRQLASTQSRFGRRSSPSIQMVTGPSLTRLTAMSAPNRPGRPRSPAARSASAKPS